MSQDKNAIRLSRLDRLYLEAANASAEPVDAKSRRVPENHATQDQPTSDAGSVSGQPSSLASTAPSPGRSEENSATTPAKERTFRLDSSDWLPKPHSKLIVGSDLVSETEPAKPAPVAGHKASEVTASQSLGGPSKPDKTGDDLDGRSPAELGSSEQRASKPAASSREVTAAWEVDAFRWPAITGDLIRTQQGIFSVMLQRLKQASARGSVIGLTSTAREEGRSTLSIALARWAAEHGLKTLLVDGDLRHGQLVDMAGLDFSVGWQDTEPRSSVAGEALVQSADMPLTLMPLNIGLGVEDHVTETAQRLNRWLSWVKPFFDLVVVDGSTATGLAACFGGATPSFDLTVIVRRLDNPQSGDLLETQSRLARLGLRHFVIAENFGRRMAG